MSERTIPRSWKDKTLTLVYSIVNAFFTLQETGGTLTTDGSEQNVYINNAPSGIFEPRVLKIDFTNHTAGETAVVRTYHRIKSGGGLVKDSETTYAGVQDPLLINTTFQPNRYGVSLTIEKTGGANRDYDWEVFFES